MRRSRGEVRRAVYVVPLIAAGLALAACNALLDFDSFTLTNDAGGTDTGTSDGSTGGTDGGDDGGCIDPAGFGGRGCFRCAPTNNDELLRACTPSTFEPFDNAARITGFNPADPTPDTSDAGPATPGPFPPPAAGEAGTSLGNCDAVGSPAFLGRPNPIMVLGATGFPMDTVAKAMGSAATIFYLEKASCVGIANALQNNTKLGDPGSVDVLAYDGVSGAATKCTLTEAFSADVNLSALFAESCANTSGLGENPSLPGDVLDFLGPVNPVMLATPFTSTEKVISAEAAYKVYGFPNSGVAPWEDENFIFRRTNTSANQQTIARTLGLPVGELRGRDSSGSSNMKNALQTSAEPNKTIGISSSEIVDVNRDVMKALAYQHFNQPVGFYPDSAPGATDRRNVRDGHYFLWIPLHVLAKTVAGDPVAATGNTSLDAITPKAERDAAVKRLVLVMTSRQEPVVKSVDYFGALKRVGNVPQCAMKVTRAKEGAPLTPLTPSAKCGCAYEAAFPGTTPAECQACADSTTCSASRPTCSFGFCE
jgi:hypothetical protein